MERTIFSLHVLLFVLLNVHQSFTVNIISDPLAHCRFQPWAPWSTCDKKCLGTQERSRAILYQHGNECEQIIHDYKACNLFCLNSGTLIGISYCSCRPGYFGPCCGKRKFCGQPKGIENGYITGSSFYYGDQIRYGCIANYNLTDGDFLRTCDATERWSGSDPRCAFVDACKSSPCQNGAICKNGLDGFTCICGKGWGGTFCEKDIMTPLASSCPESIFRKSNTPTTFVDWKTPAFHDPMGNEVQVSTNYPDASYEFPWGEFSIQYIGLKENNGLTSECLFNISVKPIPCPALEVPVNGALVCNKWKTDYGEFCIGFCMEKFTIPRGRVVGEIYACGASGYWVPSAKVPDCEVDSNPTARGYQTYFTYSNCSFKEDVAEMKRKYVQELQQSNYKYFCTKYQENCNESNVSVDCIDDK